MNKLWCLIFKYIIINFYIHFVSLNFVIIFSNVLINLFIYYLIMITYINVCCSVAFIKKIGEYAPSGNRTHVSLSSSQGS